MKTIEIECNLCHKKTEIELKKFKYKTKKGQSKFYCSHKCFVDDNKSKPIIKICLYCKKPFNSTTFCEAPKCCSKYCSSRYSASFSNTELISKKSKEAWKRGCYVNVFDKLRKYKVCSVCGGRFYGNNIYCSLLCLKNSNQNEKISNTRKQMFKNGILRVTGGTTKWIEYKNIKVQGSYEYRTCVILDDWKNKGKIKDWKYAVDRFEYDGCDGKPHNYLIDFKIWNNDDTFYYLEVKGYKKSNDDFKWGAVKNKGHSLQIWFNDDIKKEENNLRLSSSNGRARV